jgi:fumarylacetoacetase
VTTAPDETHDAALTSWVAAANDPESDFPVQNLPLGVFRRGSEDRHRIGVAIGDAILDLGACARAGMFDALDAALRDACSGTTLNGLFARGRTDARRLRAVASALLRADTPEGRAARARGDALLAPMRDCTLMLPADIGDYSDFYASIEHATNVGAMFRPDSPLLPNYKWIPIGYHGRASSIAPSGSVVRRPRGQTRPDANAPPVFGAARSLDYELEVGAFVGRGNDAGTTIPLADADEYVFGLCLVNDWSARDIQTWEYQPLGPFLSKSFATTISPWVVTLEALAPFRVAARARAAGDPEPLAYLADAGDRARGAFDVTLEVSLLSARMRDEGTAPAQLSSAAFRDMYWTLGQMLAHHASNGCNMRPGDLIASGTVSGAAKDARGCLLELTRRGAEPLMLPNGETRTFLRDGDEVIMRGWCARDGYRRIGFGECRGTVIPALTD